MTDIITIIHSLVNNTNYVNNGSLDHVTVICSSIEKAITNDNFDVGHQTLNENLDDDGGSCNFSDNESRNVLSDTSFFVTRFE